jgi:hypothetical protein
VIVVGNGGWTMRDTKFDPDSSSVDPFVFEEYSSRLTRIMFVSACDFGFDG